MNIDSIELRRYRLPLDPPFHAAWDPEPRRAFEITMVVVTAGELQGVGAGDAMPGFAGHEHLFVGRDALDLERHARVCENLTFHYGRMWPLEVALWDLAAQSAKVPLWRMLGAPTGRVRVYASTGERKDADERAAAAVAAVDAGFPAIKLRFHSADPEDDLAVVRAVREGVGERIEILVDANQGWRMPWDTSDPWDFERAARVAKALSALGAYWLEEPLERHDYAGMRALRDLGGVGIAGGEGARDLSELDQCVAHGSLDVYQPDVAWSTGVAGARRIAAAVRSAGAIYSPHTWGDGLVLLANLHVAAAFSNAPFVEYPHDPPGWTAERRDFALKSPIAASDGWVDLGEGAGLGATVDWHGIEQWRVG